MKIIQIMKLLLFTILLLMVDLETFGQKKFLGFTSLDDTVATEKNGVFILPLLYYTPDTRWAAGLAGVYYFKTQPKDSTETESRMSYVQFLADYTQNKQSDVWSVWNIFTHNENYLLKGELRFRNFPDRFYGIGNTTSKDNEERYSYNLVSVKNLFLKKIKPGWFAGIDYHFEYEYGFQYTQGGLLENGSITGYKGGIGSAFGLVSVLDTRDNVVNAHKGRLCELSSYFYRGYFGSSFNFTTLNGNYQEYWKLNKKKHVLAVQSKFRIALGDVPFLDLSTLGNDDLLRGYPKNRFRDNSFLGAQVEYRMPLFWRLGMVAFAGAGDVFDSPKDLGISNIKYSAGLGLRCVVNTAERLNIRFDYAIGHEGGYFYFMVAESF
jgi:outer membrane protein assembly factor BamA